MIYFIGSVLSSTLLLVFFKWFERYEVNPKQGIAINYISATLASFIFLPPHSFQNLTFGSEIIVGILLGVLFSFVFDLCRMTTQEIGMGITSVSMKLGVVLPVILGIFVYREYFTNYTLLGVGLGVVAIVLMNIPSKEELKKSTKHLYLPLLVWLGSGLGDSGIQFFNKLPNSTSHEALFTFLLFGSASVSSSLKALRVETKPTKYTIGLGIGLGICNYLTIFFLLRCLQIFKKLYDIDTSIVLTINNLTIIVCTVLVGVLFFKERLNRWQIFGILLSLCSIVLLNIK